MLDNSGDSSGLTLGALYNSTVQNCSAPYSGGGLLATDLLDISPSPGNLSPVRPSVAAADTLHSC